MKMITLCYWVFVMSPVLPETQKFSEVSSHLRSVKTETTRIQSVCTEDSQSTAAQKSRMNQQMSTALHGMSNSVIKQWIDILHL